MTNTLTISILFVCLTTGSGLLSQKPQDFVTVAGKSAYFNCSTSEPANKILWYHYSTNKAHRESIYQYANFTDYWYPCYRKGRYVVEKKSATGSYNLVISTVLLSDEGRYLCEDEDDEGMATLTVQVDSSPTCVAAEICKPYIKSYSGAIVCVVLIMLSIAIGGTILVMRCILVYRSKKRKQKEETEQLMHTTNNHTAKIKELESELKLKDITVDALEAKVKDLEQRLCSTGNIDYAENPALVHTIITDAGKQRREPINGMTILGKELFVSHENSSLIEVYDVEKFRYVRQLSIDGISIPMDIASCKIANCLFVIFRGGSESESHIIKLYAEREPKKKWPTGGERGRLSTFESNVIVCLFEKQLINEFNGDGKLIHTVSLMPDVGFKHPWHAIKVNSNLFVVCHGDEKDELHRVCIVDAQGNIKKELREWESKTNAGKLNIPICLVEDSERSILVADYGNQKVRLLNCFLKLQRDLIKQESGLNYYPVRIFLDEAKGLLFVAANTFKSSQDELKDGGILIFNVR